MAHQATSFEQTPMGRDALVGCARPGGGTLGSTVRVVVDGPAAPAGETERLERVLARYFSRALESYARVDVAWSGSKGWRIRRAIVALGAGGTGSEACDATRSLTACLRAEGIPVESN